jgi:hypothetical protein
VRREGIDSDEELFEFLKESTYKDTFWETVHINLKAGKIRLLLAADIIPKEMQRIIEFLNEQMSPCEVLGLEIKQFSGQGLKTLVPRVIGATMNAQSQKTVRSIPGQQWDEERFFADVTDRDALHYDIYQSIYKRSLELFDDKSWGFGKKDGSFMPYLNIDRSLKLFILYTYGRLEIQFEGLKTKPPFNNEAKRRELMQKINEALNRPLDASMDKIDKRPSIRIKEFEIPGAIDAFFEVVKWYINALKEYYK